MIGIDYKIDVLRAVFQASLFTSVVGNTYTAYGRAFVNTNEFEESVPQVQTPSTNEYVSVKFNDGLDGLSFMVVEPAVDFVNGSLKANVAIYFAVNLDVLYPTVTERAVEYLHRDVINIVKYTAFKITKIITGLDAYANFGLVKVSDNMEPHYLVRFDTEIEYLQGCTN